MRWLDIIVDSMDMNLSKLQEIVENRRACPAAVHGVRRSWHHLLTEQQRTWVCVLSCFTCPTLYDPVDKSLSGSSVHGFSRQEYWSVLPFPLPGNLPNPEIKPMSLMSPALASRLFITSTTWEASDIAAQTGWDIVL